MKKISVVLVMTLIVALVGVPVSFANQMVKSGNTILLAQADTQPVQPVGVTKGGSFWKSLTPVQQGILAGGGLLAIGGTTYMIIDNNRNNNNNDGSPSNPN